MKKSPVGNLASNVEHLAGRSNPYRVRFRVGGENKDFGYYPDYWTALVVRNLVADRLGRPQDDINEYNLVKDEDLFRIEEEAGEAMALAEELADEMVDGRLNRATMAKIKQELADQAERIRRLETLVGLRVGN